MPARKPTLQVDEPILAAHEHPLFRGVSPEVLETLLDVSMRRGYRRGMYLFVENEPIEAFYCVLAGRVKSYTSAADGRQQILGMFEAGDVLPHAAGASLSLHSRHGTTGEAVRSTIALRIPRDVFQTMIDRHPEILRNIAAMMEQRISLLEDLIRNLSLFSVPQRVARVLLREARLRGAQTSAGILFRFNWTQQDLAHLVGTTRESVSRILAEFRRDGALRPGGKGQVLLVADRLAEYF